MVTLASVFGPHNSGIDHSVVNFYATEPDVTLKDSNKHDYLHGTLVPAYGTLNSETIKAMDDQLKLMIIDVMHALAEKREQNAGHLLWDDVVSVFRERQPQTLEYYDSPIDRSDSYTKPSKVNFFKVDGSPDPIVVKEVELWFNKFISDPDVLQSTKIDIRFLASIVAQTGATISSFGTVFYGDEYHKEDLVDIAVLRFPDIDHPHFKAFRIKLSAWSHCWRVLFVQQDESGISGEYTTSTYCPTKLAYDSVTGQIRKNAIQEAEDLFS